MKPKISIVTVCFNSEKYIEQTIQSVLNQSYQNLEYIIIDGGSTDRTLSIIEKYRDRITKVISEPDHGISDAFNKGIRAATGEIVGIVNSDDMFYDTDVIQQVADQYDPDVDVYRGKEIVRNFDSGYEYLLQPTLVFSKNPIRFHVCHMATFIRRDAFEKYGYYKENFKYAMDLELMYRFNHLGAKSKKMDVLVGIFRLGGVSQTYNRAKVRECQQIVEEIGGTKLDVLIYKSSLFSKYVIRLFLNKFGIDVASKIRYGARKRQ